MPYEFRKLYADVVTEDGTVLVLYHGWAHLLGSWHGRSCVEIYRPGGEVEVLQGSARLPVPDEDVPFERLPLKTSLGNRAFELRYAPEHDGFTTALPCPGLSWSVKLARGRARARGAGAGELSGTGYVDLVTLARPARSLGLAALSWGRAHLPDATVVYTVLDFADGRRWQAGARWTVAGGPPEALDVATRIDESGRGTVTLGGTALQLEPVRVLHAGDALGPDRIPRRLDRLVARALGGPMSEARWLARVGGGWAVHERVVFGRKAARAEAARLAG